MAPTLDKTVIWKHMKYRNKPRTFKQKTDGWNEILRPYAINSLKYYSKIIERNVKSSKII